MRCHECPVSAEIQKGKYLRSEWEEVPCSECQKKSTHFAGKMTREGRTHIAFNDTSAHQLRSMATDTLGSHMGFAPAEETIEHTVHDEVVARISYVAKSILCQPSTTREIILSRLAYPTRALRIVAEQLNITTQAAHARLKQARQGWPALANVIPMKSWKWGKKKGA